MRVESERRSRKIILTLSLIFNPAKAISQKQLKISGSIVRRIFILGWNWNSLLNHHAFLINLHASKSLLISEFPNLSVSCSFISLLYCLSPLFSSHLISFINPVLHCFHSTFYNSLHLPSMLLPRPFTGSRTHSPPSLFPLCSLHLSLQFSFQLAKYHHIVTTPEATNWHFVSFLLRLFWDLGI